MNVSEYIASGILEIYVLGELPADEASYVEEMAAQHPAIQEEIHRIQETNEALAMQSSMNPRPSLRNEILDQIAPEPEKTEARAE
ncbi:MAG: anti-sigma factor, partial [Bacteroidota bacterium]